MRTLRLFLVLMSLLLTACGNQVTLRDSILRSPSSSPTQNEVISFTENSWRSEMLILVNQVREDNNVAPVELCERLNKSAQDYADEMEVTGVFSHTGKDGSNVGDRVTSAGYIWRYVSENIAVGYQDVDAVVKGWINSPGHFKNMVAGDSRHVGFGKSKGYSTHGFYWVQNFGAGGDC